MSLELQLSGSASIEWEYVDEHGRSVPAVGVHARVPGQQARRQRRNFTSTSVQKWLKVKGASVSEVEAEGRVLSQAAPSAQAHAAGSLPRIGSSSHLHRRDLVETPTTNEASAGTSATALPALSKAEAISREEAELENGLSLQSIKASMPPEVYDRLGYGRKAAADLKAQRRRAAQEKVKSQRKAIAAARRRQSQNYTLLQEKRSMQQHAFMQLSKALHATSESDGAKRKERARAAMDSRQSQVEATARARHLNNSRAYEEQKLTRAKLADMQRQRSVQLQALRQRELFRTMKGTLAEDAEAEDSVAAMTAGAQKVARLRALMARVCNAAQGLESRKNYLCSLRANVELLQCFPSTVADDVSAERLMRKGAPSTAATDPSSSAGSVETARQGIAGNTTEPRRRKLSRSGTPKRAGVLQQQRSTVSLKKRARRMREILSCVADLLAGRPLNKPGRELLEKSVISRHHQLLVDDVSRRERESTMQPKLVVCSLGVLFGDLNIESKAVAAAANGTDTEVQTDSAESMLSICSPTENPAVLPARLLATLRRFRDAGCRLCVTTRLSAKTLAASGFLAQLGAVDFPDFVVSTENVDALFGLSQLVSHVVTSSGTLEPLPAPRPTLGLKPQQQSPVNDLRLREVTQVISGARRHHSAFAAGRGERVACLIALSHEARRPSTAIVSERSDMMHNRDLDSDAEPNSGADAANGEAEAHVVRWVTDASDATLQSASVFKQLEGRLWQCSDVLDVLRSRSSSGTHRLVGDTVRGAFPSMVSGNNHQAEQGLRLSSTTRAQAFFLIVESLRPPHENSTTVGAQPVTADAESVPISTRASTVFPGNVLDLVEASDQWLPRPPHLTVELAELASNSTKISDSRPLSVCFPFLRVLRKRGISELQAVKSVTQWLHQRHDVSVGANKQAPFASKSNNETDITFNSVLAFAAATCGRDDLFSPPKTPLLEWAGWGVQILVPTYDAGTKRSVRRPLQPCLSLGGYLPNGLDSPLLANRVDPASILFDNLKSTGASEIVVCSPRDATAITAVAMTPIQKLVDGAIAEIAQHDLHRDESVVGPEPGLAARSAHHAATGPALAPNADLRSSDIFRVAYSSVTDTWKHQVPLRRGFAGVMERFAERFPRHLDRSKLTRPEDNHLVWPRRPAEITTSFLSEVFGRNINSFSIDPMPGRISAAGDALFETIRVTLIVSKPEVVTAERERAQAQNVSYSNDAVQANQDKARLHALSGRDSSLAGAEVQHAASSVLRRGGALPQVLRLRPKLGTKRRILKVARSRGKHVLERHHSHESSSDDEGAAMGLVDTAGMMVVGGARATVIPDNKSHPAEAQSKKRTATRCIMRFRHSNPTIAALADANKVYAKAVFFATTLRTLVVGRVRCPRVFSVFRSRHRKHSPTDTFLRRGEAFCLIEEDCTRLPTLAEDVERKTAERFRPASHGGEHSHTRYAALSRELALFHSTFWNHSVLRKTMVSSSTDVVDLFSSAVTMAVRTSFDRFQKLWLVCFPHDELFPDEDDDIHAMNDILCGRQGLAIQARLKEILAARPRTLLHGSLHPNRIYKKVQHARGKQQVPPNATSDESGSTHTTAPVATLTEPRGSHRRDESSDKGTDVDSQNKPRYHFVFDDWSAFCAGPPGLDVAQVLVKCLSIDDLETGVHMKVYEQYHDLLRTSGGERVDGYTFDVLTEDACIGVLFMWLYAICVSLPILSDHAASMQNDESGSYEARNNDADSSPIEQGSKASRSLRQGHGGASTGLSGRSLSRSSHSDEPLGRLFENIQTLKVALREHECVALVERVVSEVEACGSFYYDVNK